MNRAAFISGVEGLSLLAHEKDFFRESCPLGLILFARNIESEPQIKRLIGDVRDAVGADDFWVLIDQEGGRVQRLRPPLFPNLPAARRYTELYKKDPAKAELAVFEIGKFMGKRLLDLGITMNCAPCLDAAQLDAHDIIGDRSFGLEVSTIVKLGRLQAEGHLAAGSLPVMKHIPGHGRANADSHLALPQIDASHEVLSAIDFEPFKQLNSLPVAMTAHVVYSAIDNVRPVSTSASSIENIIRKEIGFDGFLMCDDVSMEALDGTIAERTKAVLSAGCDGALHCNGKFDEMEQVAENSPVLEGPSLKRFEASFERVSSFEDVNEKLALEFLAEDWCTCS
ncbi:beta-N-acetylhexosaminidase [Hyphomicrobiales bacterium 4NK60-0047b]